MPAKSGERKRCKACDENSDVVKGFAPICLPTETEARRGTIAIHLRSKTHKEAVVVNRIKGLSSSEKIPEISLMKIAKAQTHLLSNGIG